MVSPHRASQEFSFAEIRSDAIEKLEQTQGGPQTARTIQQYATDRNNHYSHYTSLSGPSTSTRRSTSALTPKKAPLPTTPALPPLLLLLHTVG